MQLQGKYSITEMNTIRFVFMDKVFWKRIWSSLVGGLCISAILLISLIIIEQINGSLNVILEEEIIGRTIMLSVVMNILGNGGVIVTEVLVALMGHPLLLDPIDPVSSLRELADYVSNDLEEEPYVKYSIPAGFLFINLVIFLGFSIVEGDLLSALLNSILFGLPFYVASLAFYIVRIGLEILLLISRYNIQHCR